MRGLGLRPTAGRRAREVERQRRRASREEERKQEQELIHQILQSPLAAMCSPSQADMSMTPTKLDEVTLSSKTFTA